MSEIRNGMMDGNAILSQQDLKDQHAGWKNGKVLPRRGLS